MSTTIFLLVFTSFFLMILHHFHCKVSLLLSKEGQLQIHKRGEEEDEEGGCSCKEAPPFPDRQGEPPSRPLVLVSFWHSMSICTSSTRGQFSQIPAQLLEMTNLQAKKRTKGRSSGHFLSVPSYLQETWTARLGVEWFRPHAAQVTLKGKKTDHVHLWGLRKIH